MAKIDAAYAGSTLLDLTKTFYPLGKSPGIDAVFYLVSQEVFSKPGANVTLCIDRVTTPEEEGDSKAPPYAAEVTKAEQDLVAAIAQVANAALDLTQTWVDFLGGTETTAAQTAAANLQGALTSFHDLSGVPQVSTTFNALIAALYGISGTVNPNVTAVSSDTGNDASALTSAFQSLTSLTAISAAGVVGVNPPVLSPPQLLWEYYNGSDWQTLAGPTSDAAANLMASGEISFTVPQDISTFMINGAASLGIRARLASGSYNVLMLVSWTDPTTGNVNYIPVIQPRPPALADIAIGYVWRSAWSAPQQSLSWNDFVVESHTPTPSTPVANYMPYHPVADTLPALYLGFNAPLPNDYISIFFDIVESDTDGPPLVWEAWSAGTWQTPTASDDTGALARSGIVAFLDPGVPARPSVNVASASGWSVTATGALAAAVFSVGDTIVIQPAQAAGW